MKFKLYIFSIFCAFMATGCYYNNEPEYETCTISLSLRTNDAIQTRTILQPHEGDNGETQGSQHVTDVYLYFFEGSGDNAKCVYVTDTDWFIYHGGYDSNPSKTATQSYTISYTFKANTPHTLLAIGLDNQKFASTASDWDGITSGETYNLPEAITVGTTLGNAVARLAAGKTVNDIAHSELFAGKIQFTTTDKSMDIGTVNLYRHVAGIQAYFQPMTTTYKGVRVWLYKSRNTQVNLFEPPYIVDSPYENETEGKLILDIPFNMQEIGSGVVGREVFGGTAFLLPEAKPDAEEFDYTLIAELVADYGTGIIGGNKRIKLVLDGENLNFQTDLGTGIIDDPNRYLYQIKVNNLYKLGSPSQPIVLND